VCLANLNVGCILGVAGHDQHRPMASPLSSEFLTMTLGSTPPMGIARVSP
jgi:hypothetical protein